MNTIFIDRDGHEGAQPTEALAKKIGPGSFFVLATVDGGLYDPLDATASVTDKDRERGVPKYAMRRCSEHCYESYLRYLGSKNRATLRVAERMFIDECR